MVTLYSVLQVKIAVGHRQRQGRRLGIGEIKGAAVHTGRRACMRDNRRDSAQVGALRQVQEDRLSGFVDFGVPGLAILGGNGEGGDQIVRRTRFDEDAPCGAQSAVPGAIGRIIGRYLIGRVPCVTEPATELAISPVPTSTSTVNLERSIFSGSFTVTVRAAASMLPTEPPMGSPGQ